MYTKKITIHKKELENALKQVKIKLQDTPILNHVKIIVHNNTMILQTVEYETKTVNQSAAIQSYYCNDESFSICAPMVNRYKPLKNGRHVIDRGFIGYPLIQYLKAVESSTLKIEFDFNLCLLKITPMDEGIKTYAEFKCLDALEFPCNQII